MIVIAGKNEIAIHGLKLALSFFKAEEIIAVVNATDNGEDAWQPSFLKYANKNSVAVKKIDEVYHLDVKVFISLEFDKIVHIEKIRTDKIYNIHFSALPRYKGMYTSVWPILFGDGESGVTLHKIDSGIDTGEIFSQKLFKLSEQDRAQDCYYKYIINSKALLDENFFHMINGFSSLPKKQVAERATYYSKSTIDFSRLVIDFNKCAWQVKRQVYAFSFRPYQLLKFNGRAVVDVNILNSRSLQKPGEVLRESFSRITVSTVDYDIELIFDDLENFLADIPEMSISDFPERLRSIAGVNDKNSKGWSPIIVAAYHGRSDIIRLLLENGANVNDVNYKGTTVLMYAKEYALRARDRAIIDLLIDAGCDKNMRDFNGKHIFEYISQAEANFLGLTE